MKWPENEAKAERAHGQAMLDTPVGGHEDLGERNRGRCIIGRNTAQHMYPMIIRMHTRTTVLSAVMPAIAASTADTRFGGSGF